MKHLSKSELNALLQVAKQSSFADELMILLSVNHGLRVSEVINLTTENFQAGHLIVQRLKGSMKTIQRLLPNEAALLSQHTPAEDGRLFPICRKTVARHLRKLGVAAGIESFKCHPHILKHTCAMIGLDGGMKINELQTYLGHKSGNSTLAYLKVSDQTACDAFASAVGLKSSL